MPRVLARSLGSMPSHGTHVLVHHIGSANLCPGTDVELHRPPVGARWSSAVRFVLLDLFLGAIVWSLSQEAY